MISTVANAIVVTLKLKFSFLFVAVRFTLHTIVSLCDDDYLMLFLFVTM